MIKQCSLFVAFSALSLIVFSIAFSSSAHAASPYDDLVVPVTSLKLSYPGYDEIDVTNNYMGYVFGTITDHVTSNNCDQTCKDIINDSLDHGDWTISQQYSNYPGDNYSVQVQFCDQKMTSTSFTTQMIGSSPFRYMYASTTTPANCAYVGVVMSSDNHGMYIYVNATYGSGYTTNAFNIAYTAKTGAGVLLGSVQPLLYTGIVTYPDGYEGSQVPSASGKTQIRPDFTYSLNQKHITARDYGKNLPIFTPDEGYTVQGYSVEWSLFKCATYEDVGHLCNTPELVDHKINLQNDDYSYDVSNFGDYQLQAQYLVQECYRYPSYPATPDNCFYIDLGTEFPQYSFTSSTVHLKVDGSSLAGDTRDGVCDESGFCQPPSVYEDCSTYGVDLVGAMGCYFRNFSVWFVVTLKMLFIPTASDISDLVNRFHALLSLQLGFLFYPVDFFVNIFQHLQSQTSTNCGFVMGPFFGNIVSLDPCNSDQTMPPLYDTVILFVRWGTVFALVYALYHKFFQLFERRNEMENRRL